MQKISDHFRFAPKSEFFLTALFYGALVAAYLLPASSEKARVACLTLATFLFGVLVSLHLPIWQSKVDQQAEADIASARGAVTSPHDQASPGLIALLKQVERDRLTLSKSPEGIDEAAVNAMTERALTFLQRFSKIEAYSRYSIYVALPLGVGLVGFLFYEGIFTDINSTMSTSQRMFRLLGAVLFVIFVYFASKFCEGQSIAVAMRSDAEKNLTLLESIADSPFCDQALEYVSKSDAARTLRDNVVLRGELLRRFHIDAMRRMYDDAILQSRRAALENSCRQLHDLSPDVSAPAASA